MQKYSLIELIALTWILSLSSCGRDHGYVYKKKNFRADAPSGQRPDFSPHQVPAPQQEEQNPPPAEPTPPVNPEVVFENFEIETHQGKIDMIWVIDNSTSMANEAAQVRENFDRFASIVAERTDINLALISKKYAANDGSSTGVDLPTSSVGGREQISASVGSSNPLAFIASSICPAETTQHMTFNESPYLFGKMSICGQPKVEVEDAISVSRARGKLSSFLREGAETVFVVVTDDNAFGMTDQNFMTHISPYLKDETPQLFSFQGIASSTCNIANPGEIYQNLIRQLGGAYYDICAYDWTRNFERLSAETIAIANSSFTLAFTPDAILSVYLDGVLVAPTKYELAGNVLKFRPGVITTTHRHVKVTYQFLP